MCSKGGSEGAGTPRRTRTHMNEIELLIEYVKAWNNLDTSYLENILSDDFAYTSQWVFETMHGRDTYITYLGGKFKTMLKNPASIPSAEIAYFRYAYMDKDKPCIVLTQRDTQASLIVQVENGRIKQADLVGFPSPDLAIRFGMEPQ
jgi:hypothetical protein